MLECIRSCCFCFSLRAGTLIIGYTFSVLSVVGTIVGRGAVLMKKLPRELIPHTGEDQERALKALRAHGIWVVAISFAYLLFCVTLVISAHRYLRYWHLPWMVSTILLVVITLVASFGDLSAWLVAIPISLLLLYCFMVVFSRYMEMGRVDVLLSS